mmetsp:Transcript_107637/g.337090  ORF Transcript_107637/g.337090 Transcript_107637/m.337090 type:complete len:211 (-) Transcript_107637:499-1131(-)
MASPSLAVDPPTGPAARPASPGSNPRPFGFNPPIFLGPDLGPGISAISIRVHATEPPTLLLRFIFFMRSNMLTSLFPVSVEDRNADRTWGLPVEAHLVLGMAAEHLETDFGISHCARKPSACSSGGTRSARGACAGRRRAQCPSPRRRRVCGRRSRRTADHRCSRGRSRHWPCGCAAQTPCAPHQNTGRSARARGWAPTCSARGGRVARP